MFTSLFTSFGSSFGANLLGRISDNLTLWSYGYEVTSVKQIIHPYSSLQLIIHNKTGKLKAIVSVRTSGLPFCLGLNFLIIFNASTQDSYFFYCLWQTTMQ